MRWLKALFRRPIDCRGIVLKQGRDDLWRWRCVSLRPGDRELSLLPAERTMTLWVDEIGDGWRNQADAFHQAWLCLVPLCDPTRLAWYADHGRNFVRLEIHESGFAEHARLSPAPLPVEGESKAGA